MQGFRNRLAGGETAIQFASVKNGLFTNCAKQNLWFTTGIRGNDKEGLVPKASAPRKNATQRSF